MRYDSLLFKVFFGLVSVFIGVIFILVIGSSIGRGCIDGKSSSEQEARTWAQQMGYYNSNVSCASRDTDGDGYISCTISNPGPNGVDLIAIDCAAALTLNEGCRMSLPNGFIRPKQLQR